MAEYQRRSESTAPDLLAAPDYTAAKSIALRRFVVDLLALRARDAAPDAPPWKRREVESELYRGDVSRVYSDLLQDSAALQHSAATHGYNADAASSTVAAEAAAAPSPLRAALALPGRIIAAVAALLGRILRGIFNPVTFSDTRVWSKRTLREFADALPYDAALQAALLRRLNQHGQYVAVMTRVQSGKYASSSACEAEHLRAVVESAAVNDLRGAGPPREGLTTSSLPEFVQQIQHRLAASGAMVNAGAGGAARPPMLAAAATADTPLRVTIDNMQPRANPVAQAVRNVASFLSTLFVVVCLWVLGAAAEGTIRSAVTAGAAAGGDGTTAGGGAGAEKQNAFAPKEYNKENVPEASQKTFADVKGCEEAKEELQEIVEFLKAPERFSQLGAKLPKGVLLSGPPGTGKTLLARAVAGEAGVPFFYRAGSEFEEMFVGVGSRRVRKLFQAAKAKAPCIIFIDEIDAIGSSRKAWENHSRKTLNQMLTEMDGFEENCGVIVMAATNLPEVLDPALTRPGRFDRRVVVSVPDVKGREEIVEYYLASKPVAPGVSARLVARKTPGFAGAQIANMINEAALAAAKQGATQITTAMLDEARDKVMMGKERSISRTVEAIKSTAYHEAGHALVALYTPGADPLHKATINPRGDALGITWQIPPSDEHSSTLAQMCASMDVAMGGTVAECIAFGQDRVGVGATADLRAATNVARFLVCECGFSDAVGPMAIDDSASPTSKALADREVARVLRESKERVKVLLAQRTPELHAVAAALIKHETLDAGQMVDVCDRVENGEPVAADVAAEARLAASGGGWVEEPDVHAAHESDRARSV